MRALGVLAAQQSREGEGDAGFINTQSGDYIRAQCKFPGHSLLKTAAPQASRDQLPLILALGIFPLKEAPSLPLSFTSTTHPVHTQFHQCPSKRKVQSRNGAPPFLPFRLHAAGDGEPDFHKRATAALTLVALRPRVRRLTLSTLPPLPVAPRIYSQRFSSPAPPCSVASLIATTTPSPYEISPALLPHRRHFAAAATSHSYTLLSDRNSSAHSAR